MNSEGPTPGDGESPCSLLPVVGALSAPPQRTPARTSDALPARRGADGDARLPPPCAAETSGRSTWRSRREPQNWARRTLGVPCTPPLGFQNAVGAMSRSQWWYWLCPDRDCGPLGRRQVCAGADELMLSGPKGPKHHLCPASAHGPRGRRPSAPAPARWNTLPTPDSHAAARLRRGLEAWCRVRRHGC